MITCINSSSPSTSCILTTSTSQCLSFFLEGAVTFGGQYDTFLSSLTNSLTKYNIPTHYPTTHYSPSKYFHPFPSLLLLLFYYTLLIITLYQTNGSRAKTYIILRWRCEEEQQGGNQMTDAVEEKGKQLVVEREKEDSNNNKTYPKPLAKYEDVVADRKLLMETLEKLHAALGTKFMIPIIGGKDLDLHRLFVEVTSRGGIEKVIRDRRWREVTSVFNFPSTATNASFILRKYYISLMHHYEQIYFFGAQGSNSPPPASLHAPSVTPVPSKRFVEPVPLSHETRVATQKRKKCDRVSLPTNYPVVGVVDGKFEHGYLVTVTVGTAKLKGILYHPPEQTAAQAPQDSGIADNNTVGGIRRRRRRKKLSSRDPTHPKPNRSGYNFFFAEQHAKLKLLHPGKDREISKMIGDLWSKLTETEKAVYQEIGLRDKERYRSEMTEYRERLKTGQIIRNAVPIQQRPAEQVVAMGDVDSKGEMEEGDLPSTHQNESSDGSDFEGKKSDKESELDTSPEAGGTATESTSFVAEPSAEVDGFELRMRDHVRTGNEHEIPSSSEDAESKKEVDSSIDKH